MLDLVHLEIFYVYGIVGANCNQLVMVVVYFDLQKGLIFQIHKLPIYSFPVLNF